MKMPKLVFFGLQPNVYVLSNKDPLIVETPTLVTMSVTTNVDQSLLSTLAVHYDTVVVYVDDALYEPTATVTNNVLSHKTCVCATCASHSVRPVEILSKSK